MTYLRSYNVSVFVLSDKKPAEAEVASQVIAEEHSCEPGAPDVSLLE